MVLEKKSLSFCVLDKNSGFMKRTEMVRGSSYLYEWILQLNISATFQIMEATYYLIGFLFNLFHLQKRFVFQLPT